MAVQEPLEEHHQFYKVKNIIPGFSKKPAEAVPASTDAATAETSTSDELEKLAGLRDQGVITDEEFEAKKKQLLGL